MKALFIPIVVINWLCILVILHKYVTDAPSTRMLAEPEFEQDEPLKFYDPATAYFLLEELDTYKRPENVTGILEYTYPTSYNKYHFGLTADDQYCSKHRAYFVQHPENIFENVKIFIDYMGSTLMRRQIVKEVGVDIQMNIGGFMPKNLSKSQVFDIRTDVTVFFCGALYWAREVSTQFSCLTQASNHIPGHTLLYSKSHVAEAMNDYRKLYTSRPQCFGDGKFFPRTFLLDKQEECFAFFEEINSPSYKEAKKERQAIYIRKLGAALHASAGIELLHDDEEREVRRLYDNGNLCGISTRNYIIQTLVDPLLLDGHKFDFRVYLLVASTNPMIAYFHEGVLWVSLHKFNQNSTSKEGFVPNVSFNSDILKIAKENGTYEGKTVAELKDFSVRFFDDLQAHLYERGMIHDENWLDSYLRPEFMKAMVHLVRMAQGPLLKASSVYELYGCDFMLDKNLNLWFIEANIFPNLDDDTPREKEFLVKMLKDHYEIVNGLLRSRTKRIIQYVNTLMREQRGGVDADGNVFFDDYEIRHAEFKEASKNWFELEYEPSSTNGFRKVLDYNFRGVERYSGLLSEQCI